MVISQFGLLSHISSLRLSSGHSGLVFTLSTDDASRASLTSTHSLAVTGAIWATSPLAVAVRCIFCGFYLFPWLCCPLSFQNSPQTCLGEGFLLCGNFSSMTPSPGWVSISNSFVSLFVLDFVPPPFKENGLPYWVPPPEFRSFVEFAQHSNDLLMNLWGRKQSSHPIPSPSWDHPPFFFS